MRYTFRILIVSIVGMMLINCDQSIKEPDVDDVKFTINVDPQNSDESVHMSDLYSDVEYIPLETSESSLIGVVSSVIKHKNRFYIMDNDVAHSIFCFADTGEFLYKINSIGSGPGEYVDLTDFTINYDEEEILIYDNSLGNVLHFSIDGDYKETQRVGFHSFHLSYISDGYFAFFNDFTMSNKELLKNGVSPNLVITDSKFEIAETGMYYSLDANFSAIPMSSHCLKRFDQETISLLPPLSDTIFHVSKDEISPYLHINFNNNQREQDIKDLMHDSNIPLDAIIRFINANGICDIFSFVESSGTIFFCYSKFNDSHYVFYDKVSNNIKDIVFKTGNKFPIINDIDGGVFVMPTISDGELFYGIVLPSELCSNKEDKLLDNVNARNKKQIIELMNQISEEDNPIIAIITPKKTSL